tara:strand:+ start:5290 stop:5526 length:237 start_codon:yes stop_codon:yes gene_type:complete
MAFHMSVTKQEAMFLKNILAKHLDDYVEELVREEKNNTDMVKHMMQNRDTGKSLMDKASEVNRRASRQSDTPYFTNLK